MDSSRILSLENKRKELTLLIKHIRSRLGHDEESKLSTIVLSRLLAEVRRIEVEQMRSYILNCPGLNKESTAYQIAFSALDESIDHINRHEELLDSSGLAPCALTSSILENMSNDDIKQEVTDDSLSDISLADNTHTSEPFVVQKYSSSLIGTRSISKIANFS
jgi:hypothetical protein